MFDADTFLATSTKEATATKLVPIPEGDYQAVIETVSARQSGDFTILDVTWNIDDAEVAKITGRERNTCRQSIFLDITEQGGLDCSAGRNVQLGRLREAVGQNKSGKAWSPNQLVGNVAMVQVSHRFDKEDDSIIYADIKRVTAV